MQINFDKGFIQTNVKDNSASVVCTLQLYITLQKYLLHAVSKCSQKSDTGKERRKKIF